MKKLFLILTLLTLSLAMYAETLEEFQRQIAKAQKDKDLKGAIDAYDEMLKVYEKIGGEVSQKPGILMDYALVLCYSGNYSKAIDQLTQVIVLTENDPNQKESLARSYMQMGLINFFMGQYDSALEHYLRAKELAEEIENNLGVSIANNNIGNVYQKKLDYSNAISYYQKTLSLQKEVKDSATICNTLFNLGTCYEELGQLPDADHFFTESYVIAKTIGDKEIASLALIHSGIINKNLNHIENSLHLVEKSGHNQVLIRAYETYAMLKAEKGEYKESYKLSQKSKALADSLFKADAARNITEFSVKYKAKELEAEKEIQKTVFIAVAILFTVIIILLIITVRIHRKANNKLQEINTLKDKFVSVVSHDIKNPLISQKRVLELVVDNLEEIPKEEMKILSKDLLNSSRSLLDLLYNLLNWSQIESKTIKYNPTNIDILTITKEAKDTLNLSLIEKNLSVNISSPDSPIAIGDYNMLSTVIRNLLNNAIKYSHPNSNIDITIVDNTRKDWSINIKDYGVGMSDKTQNSLFKLKTVKSKLGTKGETGSGLGLLITKEMVNMNGGTIRVESKEGVGTEFNFTIRKANERN